MNFGEEKKKWSHIISKLLQFARLTKNELWRNNFTVVTFPGLAAVAVPGFLNFKSQYLSHSALYFVFCVSWMTYEATFKTVRKLSHFNRVSDDFWSLTKSLTFQIWAESFQPLGKRFPWFQIQVNECLFLCFKIVNKLLDMCIKTGFSQIPAVLNWTTLVPKMVVCVCFWACLWPVIYYCTGSVLGWGLQSNLEAFKSCHPLCTRLHLACFDRKLQTVRKTCTANKVLEILM